MALLRVGISVMMLGIANAGETMCASSPEGCVAKIDTDPNTLMQTRMRIGSSDVAENGKGPTHPTFFSYPTCIGDSEADAILSRAHMPEVTGMVTGMETSVYSWNAFCQAAQQMEQLGKPLYQGSLEGAARTAAVLSNVAAFLAARRIVSHQFQHCEPLAPCDLQEAVVNQIPSFNGVNVCDEPDRVCEDAQLKWLAGLNPWTTQVQNHDNFLVKLENYVRSGFRRHEEGQELQGVIADSVGPMLDRQEYFFDLIDILKQAGMNNVMSFGCDKCLKGHCYFLGECFSQEKLECSDIKSWECPA